MPYYKPLTENTIEGKRTLANLIRLRQQLDSEIPARNLDHSILIATWNIREFDSAAYGDRLEEAMYYIAEIVDRFDVIAIQEVRDDLKALNRLLKILGSPWKAVFSDVTEGKAGNGECMAFVYDSRKVYFAGLASELVLPPLETRDENGKRVVKPVTQIARTPYMCGFRAGWTNFVLTTVHILYGTSKAEDPKRVEEIRQLAQFLRSRTLSRNAWSRNYVLLGDFNIFDPSDVTMQAITDAGFEVPKELQDLPSNVAQNKYYDQIAFRARQDRFATTSRAGVFNFFKSVFRPEDEAEYAEAMGDSYHITSSGKVRANQSLYYLTYWRTHQMSDHLPMWVELRIDYSTEYLERKLG